MANYNILMNRFNGTTHDTLLPKNSLEGTSNPTTSTVGIVGQFYLNTTTKQLFQCSTVSGSVYTWVPFYNATQMLDNTTKAKYGLTTTATPNDAFNSLATNMVATRKTYPVKAGNVVSAGDVVDVVGGEVQKTLVGQANVKKVFANYSPNALSVVKMNDVYSIGCFSLGASGDGNPRAFLINNATGAAYGSYGQFSATPVVDVSCARLTDTSFIVQYQLASAVRARVGIVSNNVITFGNEYTVGPVNSTFNTVVFLSNTSFLSIYDVTGIRAKVCDVSGTAITMNTEFSLPLGIYASATYMSATRLPDAPNGNIQVCVCYKNVGDSDKGRAVIATINASKVVSWGTQVVFENTALGNSGLSCCADNDDAIVFYVAGSVGYAKVLSVDGSTIVPNTALTVSTATVAYPAITEVGNKFAVNWNHSNVSKALVLTRNGNTLSKGAEFIFNAGGSTYISSASLDDEKIMVIYRDSSNSNYGTATILTVQGNQIAGSFTNTSSQAIALQSGTSPESIEIIYNGVAPLAGIAAGTQITSPGVQGYAPQDGWLWVRPEWDNSPTGAAYGSYTGQNSDYNTSRLINLGFKPDVVVVTLGATSNLSPKSMYILVRDSNILELKNGAYPAFTAPLANGYVYIMDIADSGFLVGRAIDVIGQPYKYMALKM